MKTYPVRRVMCATHSGGMSTVWGIQRAILIGINNEYYKYYEIVTRENDVKTCFCSAVNVKNRLICNKNVTIKLTKM